MSVQILRPEEEATAFLEQLSLELTHPAIPTSAQSFQPEHAAAAAASLEQFLLLPTHLPRIIPTQWDRSCVRAAFLERFSARLMLLQPGQQLMSLALLEDFFSRSLSRREMIKALEAQIHGLEETLVEFASHVNKEKESPEDSETAQRRLSGVLDVMLLVLDFVKASKI